MEEWVHNRLGKEGQAEGHFGACSSWHAWNSSKWRQRTSGGVNCRRENSVLEAQMKHLFVGKYLMSETTEKRCRPYLHLHFHTFPWRMAHLLTSTVASHYVVKTRSSLAPSPAARTICLLFIKLLSLVLLHSTCWNCSWSREPLLYAWDCAALPFWLGNPSWPSFKTYPSALPS